MGTNIKLRDMALAASLKALLSSGEIMLRACEGIATIETERFDVIRGGMRRQNKIRSIKTCRALPGRLAPFHFSLRSASPSSNDAPFFLVILYAVASAACREIDAADSWHIGGIIKIITPLLPQYYGDCGKLRILLDANRSPSPLTL